MNREEKREKTILTIILCFLAVAISVLAFFVITNISKNSNTPPTELCDSTSLEIVQTCANQIANDTDNDYDAIIEYYNTSIAKSLEAEDYSSARKLIASRSEFFVLRNDCEKAFELIDNTNIDGFPDEQRVFLLSSFADIGMECADLDRYNLYDEQLRAIKEGIPNAIGF